MKSPLLRVTTYRDDALSRARDNWHGDQMGVNEESFIAMTSVLRLHRTMTLAIEREFKAIDIKLNDFMVLITLELSPKGTRPIARLAHSLMIHPTTATTTTDRLEARGLLTRNPHPSDRRATLVSITPAGRDLIKRAFAALERVGYGLPCPSALRADLVAAIDEVRAAAGD